MKKFINDIKTGIAVAGKSKRKARKEASKQPKKIIWSCCLETDEYTKVKAPFTASKGHVYIDAPTEEIAREKLHNKFNEFLINNGLNDAMNG